MRNYTKNKSIIPYKFGDPSYVIKKFWNDSNQK